jgi:ferritin-like metal-binding protein YciE
MKIHHNPIHLGPAKLLVFFAGFLDRIYCAKIHLVERLPELAFQSHFSDLRHAISETLEDVNLQIHRMDEIYRLLNRPHSAVRCDGLVAMVEDAYSAIHEHPDDPELRDLAILFYMQNIESVEAASFQVLQLAAVKMKNERIKQLLLENYDDAKADRALFLLITAKYLTN